MNIYQLLYMSAYYWYAPVILSVILGLIGIIVNHWAVWIIFGLSVLLVIISLLIRFLYTGPQ